MTGMAGQPAGVAVAVAQEGRTASVRPEQRAQQTVVHQLPPRRHASQGTLAIGVLTPGSDSDAVLSLFMGIMICLPRSSRFPRRL